MASITEIAALAGLSPSTVSLVLRKKPPYSKEAEQKVNDAVAALNARVGRPAVTIREVAEKAGTSVASVSNVLNGYRVSPILYAKIIAAIEELGYVGIAQRPRQTSTTVLLCDNNLDGNISSGIYSHLNGAGCKVLQLNWEYCEIPELLTCIVTHHVAGVVFCNCEKPEMVRTVAEKVPVVQCGYIVDAGCSSSICSDFRQAALDATLHLLDTGKRAPSLVISELPESLFALESISGFHQALGMRGIPASDRIHHLEPPIVPIYDQQTAFLREWLEDGDDAFLFTSATLAVAHVFLLEQMGIPVPDRASVAALTSCETIRLCRPELTFTEHACIDIGVEAAQQILNLISDPETTPHRTLFRPRLQICASTLAAK